MRTPSIVLLTAVLALGLAGCAHRHEGGGEPREHGRSTTPPPAGSPFAKLQAGMTQREVQNLIGPPTDEKSYVTGKAFIPWYFGPDRARTAYFYKGQGRVVFAGGSISDLTGRVSRVEYDPNESGHAR